MSEHGIEPIDMVVVNLYAFEKTAAKPGVEFEDIIENIDIGGPSMVRSAAKNFQDVAIVTSPADYDAIASEMESSGGVAFAEDEVAAGAKGVCDDRGLRFGDRVNTASGSALRKAKARSSNSAARRFSRDAASQLPQGIRPALRRESAPEGGALLRRLGQGHCEWQAASGQGTQLQQHRRSAGSLGPGAGIRRDRCAPSSSTPIPAEPRWRATLAEAYKRALECDPVSAFGGVIGVNRPIDADTATEMAKLFVEAIAAPRLRRRRARDLRDQEEPAPGGSRPPGAEVGAEERLRRRAAAGQRHASR